MGPSKKIVIGLEYFSNWQSSSGRTWNDGHSTASSLAQPLALFIPSLRRPLPVSTELVGLPRKINLSVFFRLPGRFADNTTVDSIVRSQSEHLRTPSTHPRDMPRVLPPQSVSQEPCVNLYLNRLFDKSNDDTFANFTRQLSWWFPRNLDIQIQSIRKTKYIFLNLT